MKPLLRCPTALLPLAFSLVALVFVGVHLLARSPAREVDEGPAAHLFQLLIAIQLPLILLFIWRWIRRAPGPTLSMVALQVCALLVAMAPVAFFGL